MILKKDDHYKLVCHYYCNIICLECHVIWDSKGYNDHFLLCKFYKTTPTEDMIKLRDMMNFIIGLK